MKLFYIFLIIYFSLKIFKHFYLGNGFPQLKPFNNTPVVRFSNNSLFFLSSKKWPRLLFQNSEHDEWDTRPTYVRENVKCSVNK